MRKWNNDDLFYVCSMIEFVARETHNKTKDIVAKLSDKELAHQLKAAGVNHCLSFEQVCDEWIEEYGIESFTELSDGKLLFEHDYADDEGVLSWMLTKRDKVTNIEPETIRQKLFCIATDIAEKYRKESVK